MSVTSVVIIIVAVIIVAAVGLYLLQKQSARRLRYRFGPEYERAVQEHGSALKAEQDLRAREKRMDKVHLRPLSNAERDGFARQWLETQARFVDDPGRSIQEADHLLYEVMMARGYPMADFEHRAEDISVDHPQAVQNYRLAHEIALSEKEGKASTEDLRKALVYYRDLFDDLIGSQVARSGEVRR
jgi:hypothetical protein